MAKKQFKFVQIISDSELREGVYGGYFKYEFGTLKRYGNVDFAANENDDTSDREDYTTASRERQIIFEGEL